MGANEEVVYEAAAELFQEAKEIMGQISECFKVEDYENIYGMASGVIGLFERGIGICIAACLDNEAALYKQVRDDLAVAYTMKAQSVVAKYALNVSGAESPHVHGMRWLLKTKARADIRESLNYFETALGLDPANKELRSDLEFNIRMHLNLLYNDSLARNRTGFVVHLYSGRK